MASFLLAAALHPAGSAASDSCADCGAKRKLLVQHRNDEARYKDLLLRNQSYLKSQDGNDTSKLIKVKSNILVILLRIDTLKNDASALDGEIRDQCRACP